MEKATFAAGCFWGVEASFMQLPGVSKTTVGYTGGSLEGPSYELVCRGGTGHAEAVELEFDPIQITFEQLLGHFFKIHDPTTLNRQGPDVGTQYRSAIFYHNLEQKKLAEAFIIELVKAKHFSKDIVTEITSAKTFWEAEEYHQKYLQKRGQSFCPTNN